jgi:ubiquinone/menaquinone biosynthesis C-methylase UbiE
MDESMKDEYYNKISQGYDELYGEEQRQKLDKIKERIRPGPTTSILDVGCGTGISSEWDCQVFGVDPNIGMLQKNKKPSVVGFGESLPFKDESFDYVITLSSIHHMKYEKALAEMSRVCRYNMVVSVLKKSKSYIDIITYIQQKFHIDQKIEDDKDTILILS